MKTTTELVAALRERRISAVEALEQSIARIEARDGAINAVVVRDFERARAAAKAADEALARGERGPLLGVPISVKEAFDVGGLPTTWGIPGTERCIAVDDAVAVARLKAAGAVVLGKTNVPTMLADWQTLNPIYGVTNNPWRRRSHAGRFVGRLGRRTRRRLRAPSSSAPTSSARCARRHTVAACSRTSRPTAWCRKRGFAPPGTPVLSVGVDVDLAVIGPMARTPPTSRSPST